jgi:hypothetical protein
MYLEKLLTQIHTLRRVTVNGVCEIYIQREIMIQANGDLGGLHDYLASWYIHCHRDHSQQGGPKSQEIGLGKTVAYYIYCWCSEICVQRIRNPLCNYVAAVDKLSYLS